MKKALFTSLTFLVCCITAHAQFGINAGLGLGKYKFYVNGKRYERSTELTYSFGAFYHLQSGAMAVRPELDYAPVITKIDAAGLGTGVLYYRNRLNYLRLSLPVLLCIGDKDAAFVIGAGPFFSRLLKATSTEHDLEDHETKRPFKIGTSATDDFTPGDVGLQIHLGVRARHLVGSITDNLGYHNVTPKANQQVMTRSLMVNLGVIF